MRTSWFKASFALCLISFTATPALAQVVIDNFSLPPQGPTGTDYLVVSGASGTAARFVQPAVDAIGGTRIFYGQKTNAGTSSVFLGISGGTQMFRQNVGPDTSGRSKVLYGYSEVSVSSLNGDNYTTGHTLNNLNLNVGAGSGISLSYALGGTSATGSIVVTLVSGSEGAPQVSSVTLPIVSTTNASFTFTNAQFLANNGALNLSDIDQVIVSLNGVPPGFNATIDNIQVAAAAVPEPASIALIGLSAAGATGYFWRLRKKRQRFGRRT
jgi:hypothetical protein